ncbi:NlpC/P60 family protein, partial [Clostridiaceae bacterium]|nr:NlpC/P60 family protein [Clostridiaceae bacterium]
NILFHLGLMIPLLPAVCESFFADCSDQVQTGALTKMLLPENKALLTELIGWATGTGGEGSIGGVGNINGYEVPPEALSDERFAAMLNEAKKYLGYPYVWGGSSPSTSFDCSGFVCWVLNKSGAMSIGRTTATGIYNRCTVINKSDAKPGDLIFFTSTYNSPGPISHIGIYAGNGMMVHSGDPIQFTSTESSYWKKHFYAMARIP